jgi:ribosome-associated heat shock protein Hsp15
MKPANGAAPQPSAPQEVRLDVWLDVACLFKTRSEAQKACRGGKVDLNGQSGKPHRALHVGDQLRITRAAGRRQRVIVRALGEQHVTKAEARLLYEDVTPPPTPEEVALRDLERHFWTSRVRARPHAGPTKSGRLRLEKESEG